MSSDCCSWEGVVCDETTGHVIELDLSCSGLVGKIDSNSSLFQLSHLQRIDLSGNNFSNSHISPEFGKFSSLTHLKLSHSNFSGQIPSEISHLSNLHSLHLPTNLRFTAHDFKLLLQNLTQLRELDLTYINISSTIPLNFSSHFTTLELGDTGLYGKIPESIFQLPNLETLDLSYNDELSGYFPKMEWNSSASIKDLDLSGVNFSDNFPELIPYLTSLQGLSLESCNLRGPFPEFLLNLLRIETLDLSRNSLNGTIPERIFQLPNLETLDLSKNDELSGYFPKMEWNSSASIKYLYLNGVNFSDNFPESIPYLTSLQVLSLRNSNLRGPIPEFLSNLPCIENLDLSFNSLNGTIPSGIFSLPSLTSLYFSNNQFSGQIEDFKSNSLL